MKYSVLIDPLYTPSELIRSAKQAEEFGFCAFWYPDEKFFRDCYVGLTLVAHNTKEIRLGPCVTDPYSRHPIMTAAAIASLAEVAPGRTWLGLGAGGRGFDAIGITREQPAVALKEAIIILRKLIAGESVDYHGKIINLQDRPLDFKPIEYIPIMIGTGHGMLVQRLAGEMADAVMIANYSTPIGIQHVLNIVESGANRTGRRLDDIHKISRVDVAIHEDSQLAKEAVAPKILSSLRSSYPNLEYLEVLPQFDLSSELITVLRKKDYATRNFYANPKNSAPIIPRSLTDNLSIAGDPDEVVQQIYEIKKLRVIDEFTFRLLKCEDQTIFDSLELLYRKVMPLI